MNKHPNPLRDVLPPDEVLLEPSGQFGPGDQFGNDLRNFRAAVHRAAERQTSQPVPFGWLNAARRRRQVAQRRLMLAWATVAASAALLFAATMPLLHHPTTVSTPVAVTQVRSTDDTALLEQIDTAVSESVPSSLAPLAELDDLNSTNSTNNERTPNKPEKKNVSQ